jgi:hypothetical protein
MTGRKKLKEIRAELESALGAGPTGGSPVREALRRFITGNGEEKTPLQLQQHSTKASKQPKKANRSRTRGR